MHFEPNLGQTAEEVRFLARGPGYTLFLTNEEAVLVLRKGQPREVSHERIKDPPSRRERELWLVIKQLSMRSFEMIYPFSETTQPIPKNFAEVKKLE